MAVLLTVVVAAALGGPQLGAAATRGWAHPDGFGSGAAGQGWTPDEWTLGVAPAPNPPLVARCGIDVALLIDRSGSIERAGATGAVRAAAHAFVDGLVGTPSRLGLWSFADDSASHAGDPAYPALELTSLGPADGGPGAVAARAAIDAIPHDDTAATNWQAGFDAVHEASVASGHAPDLLVVITDGRPTVHDADHSSGASTDGADVDAGVAAANRVKADGTRVLAVGLGSQLDERALAAVSGPTRFDGADLASADQVLTDVEGLVGLLRQFASELCGGTVTVRKLIRSADGTREPVSGWPFVVDSPTDPSWSQLATTGADGTAVFELGSTAAERVRVVESARPGFELVRAESSCRSTTGHPAEVAAVDGGFVLDVGPTDAITCTFVNAARHVDLSLHKDDGGASVRPGGDVTYQLEVRNGGTVDATGVVVVETVPDHAVVDLGSEPGRDGNPGWTCDGSDAGLHVSGERCAFAVGAVAPGAEPTVIPFVVTALDPMPAGVDALHNEASVADDGAHGPDADPSDDRDDDWTPIVATATTTSTVDTTVTTTVEPPPSDNIGTPDKGAGASTTSTAPTAVAGVVEQRGVARVAGVLPQTGAEQRGLVAVGVGLVAAGVVLALATRRR